MGIGVIAAASAITANDFNDVDKTMEVSSEATSDQCLLQVNQGKRPDGHSHHSKGNLVKATAHHRSNTMSVNDTNHPKEDETNEENDEGNEENEVDKENEEGDEEANEANEENEEGDKEDEVN